MSLSTSAATERVPLYINSAQRSTGTNENFTITLANPVARVIKCEVVSAEVTYSFYTINSTNNQLVFSVGGTPYTATVTPGNYNITDFMTALTAAMNAQFAGFTMVYNRNIYKLTISNASAFQLVFAGSTLATSIGLSANTAIATAVTPQNIINISGPKSLLIRSNRLTRPKIIRPFLNQNQQNILYKIPITGGPGDILVEKNVYSSPITYGIRQTVSDIDLQLVDENDQTIDLNGQTWSCTIVLIQG